MKDLGLVSVMLTAQFLDVVVNTVSKSAMKKGINNFVFVMYSNAFAACFLFPLTLFFYRKRTLPPLTWAIVAMLFVLSLSSCSIQLLKFFGIAYSSPTLTSALNDLIPAFTFILAIIFRMEKLNWKANSTRAKSIGTLVSIAGALIITLYKGQAIINNHPSHKLFPERLVSSEQFDWMIGAVLLTGHSCVISIQFILLARIIREYPAALAVLLIRIILTCILSVPAALISVNDLKALRLGFSIELIAIGCAAIFDLSFRGFIYTWLTGKKGPVYVTMFKPLEIVYAVILGITFLGDSLYIGSVIGAAIVVIGFYAVLWGKIKEKVEVECTVYNSESYDTEVPLLRNKRTGE